MTNAMTRHSDAEILAAFVDGDLDREQLQAVSAHLAACEECRGVIGEAGAFERKDEAHQSPQRTWWAVAAAVVIVAVLAFPFVQGALRRRDIRNGIQTLFVAEGNGERPIEGRFGGQVIYGQAHRIIRGEGNESPLEIQAAAAELLETTNADNSPVAIR